VTEPHTPRSEADNLLRLHRAVNRLAYPYAIAHWQPAGPYSAAKRTSTMHPALITQLRTAITLGSTSGGEAGGGEARAKSLLNADALEKFTQLETQITLAWIGLVPVLDRIPSAWPAENALASWHASFVTAYQHGAIDPEPIDYAAHAFNTWVHMIEALFVPTVTVTNWRPCPACGERWAQTGDPRDPDRVPAISVHVARIDRASATCRACGERWEGGEEIKELARRQRILESLTTDDTPKNETTMNHGMNVLS
jgi:hypothetical protein